MPRRPGALSSAQRNPLPLPAVHLSAEHPAAMVRAQARAGAWVPVRPGAHIETQALDAIVAGLAGRRGVGNARTVMRYADEGAESASETLSRYILLRAGLPRPTTQLRIPTRSGIYWADLGWEEERAALEYDGEGKYAGAAGAAELRREKARHDAITETGFRLGRVVAADLHSPQNLIARAARLLRVDHLHPRRDLA